jgi:8-oxo-dGTP pyrophosphatase MutT (NUDIX family)
MERTAGLFLFNNKNQLLICRTTRSKPESWSIPKGLIDKTDPNPLYAAIRECVEETNINVLNYCKYYTDIKPLEEEPYTGVDGNKKPEKKLLSFYFSVDHDFNDAELKCNSFVNDDKSFPEVDKFEWVYLDNELISKLHYTQIRIINKKIKEWN